MEGCPIKGNESRITKWENKAYIIQHILAGSLVSLPRQMLDGSMLGWMGGSPGVNDTVRCSLSAGTLVLLTVPVSSETCKQIKSSGQKQKYTQYEQAVFRGLRAM